MIHSLEPIDIFTVRERRQRSGDLLRNAESGHLALVTKHGSPAFITVPIDERLLKHGVNKSLALHFFQSSQVTLSQVAKNGEYCCEPGSKARNVKVLGSKYFWEFYISVIWGNL